MGSGVKNEFKFNSNGFIDMKASRVLISFCIMAVFCNDFHMSIADHFSARYCLFLV